MLKLEKLNIDSKVENIDKIKNGQLLIGRVNSPTTIEDFEPIASGVFEVNKNHRGTYATFDAVGELSSDTNVKPNCLFFALHTIVEHEFDCPSSTNSTASAGGTCELDLPTEFNSSLLNGLQLNFTVPEGSTIDNVSSVSIQDGKLYISAGDHNGNTDIVAGKVIVKLPKFIASGNVKDNTSSCNITISEGRVLINGICRLTDQMCIKPNLTHLSKLDTTFDC